MAQDRMFTALSMKGNGMFFLVIFSSQTSRVLHNDDGKNFGKTPKYTDVQQRI